jgi:O-antigen/teichoic acid export membrane protein
LNNVRVTYSGLIAFLVSIGSLLTGMLFVIIVTRRLLPEEFGLWTLIGTMVAYVTIIQPIVSYWSTRQIARGEEIGKTAVVTGSIFSMVGFTVYAIIVIIVSASLGASINVLMLASALVPLNILNSITGSILLGYKPHAVSYGLISFEISKIPFGLIFVYFIPLGITGALLATIGASGIRLIVLLFLCRKKIVGEIKKQVIKFWLKMSWLVAYEQFSGIIFRFDVMLISFATTSFTGLAFWGAAQTLGFLVLHSGQISQALYPKLLAEGKKQFAEDNIKRSLFFALPILGACIVFAKPGLHILNPLYVDASFAVYFLALGTFSNTLRSVFYKILSGYEHVDTSNHSTFRDYIKSKLFLIPTLEYAYVIIYIISLSIFLMFYRDSSDIFLVNNWAFLMFIASIPITTYTVVVVKKHHNLKIPIFSIMKYVLITIISSVIVFYTMENFITYRESVFDFLPEIIPFILFAGILYFGIAYIIDQDTRKLFRGIINEIKQRK